MAGQRTILIMSRCMLRWGTPRSDSCSRTLNAFEVCNATSVILFGSGEPPIQPIVCGETLRTAVSMVGRQKNNERFGESLIEGSSCSKDLER